MLWCNLCFALKNLYNLLLCTGLKLTCGIKPQLLELGGFLYYRGFDAVYRSWICDKPRFNRSFVVLICALKENGEQFEKFNSHNFELWKLKMEVLLVYQEQWIVVDLGTKPTWSPQDDWDKLERRERSTIWFFLSNSMLLNLSSEDSAVNIWGKLGSLYQS